MKNVFLKGKDIYLRPLEEKDLKGNYVSWLNDSEVNLYNSHHVFPYSKEEGLAYIKASKKNTNTLVLAIVTKTRNVHVGNIALQNIDFFNRSAEFAILVGEKKFWNKGFSKEAAKLIIEHGFTALNLNRIYCGLIKENIAMNKLALFLGMKKEGVRRQALYKGGTFHDIIEYGILRKEFKYTSK